MQNYPIKWLLIILVIIAVGFGGYFIGKQQSTNQGASVQAGVTNQNEWWPAGGGLCWHRVKPWAYMVLGEIKGTKCLAISGQASDDFINLVKNGGVQITTKTSVVPTTEFKK